MVKEVKRRGWNCKPARAMGLTLLVCIWPATFLAQAAHQPCPYNSQTPSPLSSRRAHLPPMPRRCHPFPTPHPGPLPQTSTHLSRMGLPCMIRLIMPPSAPAAKKKNMPAASCSRGRGVAGEGVVVVGGGAAVNGVGGDACHWSTHTGRSVAALVPK